MSTTLIERTNFYEQLGLAPKESTPRIREQLEMLHRGWTARSGRSGLHGAETRENLEVIAAAQQVFSSDAARDAYDRSLTTAASLGQPRQEVDWLRIGWNYYFMADYGPAAVSVRRAKTQHPQDPRVLVLSSWVQMAEDDVKGAKAEVDEAFVLDEHGEEAVDILHARGWCFYRLGQYERAVQALSHAMQLAEGAETADISARLALAKEAVGDERGAIDAAHRSFDVQSTGNPWVSPLCALLERCIVNLHQDVNDLGTSIMAIHSERRWFAAHHIDHPAAAILLTALDGHLERLDQLADCRSVLVRARDAARTAERTKRERKDVETKRPGLPWVSALIAVAATVGALSLPVLWGVALAAAGVAAFGMYRRLRPAKEEVYAGYVPTVDTEAVEARMADLREYSFATYPA